MSKCLFAAAVCLASLMASTVVRAGEDAALGKHVDNFSLRDFHGNLHTLAQYGEKKAVVLVFLGTECPLARLYAPRLQELSRELADKGVAFLGMDANSHDTPTMLTAFAQTHHVEFPLLKDVGNVVADQLGAARTPEVFVLDAQRVVRYHGRIDDQYGIGVQRTKPTRRDLAVALDELLGGRAVSEPASPASGCLIARVSKIEPHGDVTYNKHVAAIVNRRCGECHREGELAPFPLTTYDEVAGWAQTIREVVSDNRMPPWFADPQFGKFANDCSLSKTDKQTIFTWIDNGCPEGNRSDLPTPPAFTAGWRMGTPDAVYRMPESFAVPAGGTVDYQYFTVDPQLKEDVWITTAEARPGMTSRSSHIAALRTPSTSMEMCS